MKKLLSAVLAGLILSAGLLLPSCDRNGGTEREVDVNISALRLVEKNTLTVGMEIGYPPFESFAEDGVTPVGFDVDLANAIGDKLGLSVSIVNTPWNTIFDGIGTEYDLAISGIAITELREETLGFSEPYITSSQCVVTAADSELSLRSFEDLTRLRISVVEDTVSDDLISRLEAEEALSAEIIRNMMIPQCFDDLTQNRADAVISDSTVADAWAAKHPGLFRIAYRDTASPKRLAAAMNPENTALRDAVNEALRLLEEEGFLSENMEKWFG